MGRAWSTAPWWAVSAEVDSRAKLWVVKSNGRTTGPAGPRFHHREADDKFPEAVFADSHWSWVFEPVVQKLLANHALWVGLNCDHNPRREWVYYSRSKAEQDQLEAALRDYDNPSSSGAGTGQIVWANELADKLSRMWGRSTEGPSHRATRAIVPKRPVLVAFDDGGAAWRPGAEHRVSLDSPLLLSISRTPGGKWHPTGLSDNAQLRGHLAHKTATDDLDRYREAMQSAHPACAAIFGVPHWGQESSREMLTSTLVIALPAVPEGRLDSGAMFVMEAANAFRIGSLNLSLTFHTDSIEDFLATYTEGWFSGNDLPHEYDGLRISDIPPTARRISHVLVGDSSWSDAIYSMLRHEETGSRLWRVLKGTFGDTSWLRGRVPRGREPVRTSYHSICLTSLVLLMARVIHEHVRVPSVRATHLDVLKDAITSQWLLNEFAVEPVCGSEEKYNQLLGTQFCQFLTELFSSKDGALLRIALAEPRPGRAPGLVLHLRPGLGARIRASAQKDRPGGIATHLSTLSGLSRHDKDAMFARLTVSLSGDLLFLSVAADPAPGQTSSTPALGGKRRLRLILVGRASAEARLKQIEEAIAPGGAVYLRREAAGLWAASPATSLDSNHIYVAFIHRSDWDSSSRIPDGIARVIGAAYFFGGGGITDPPRVPGVSRVHAIGRPFGHPANCPIGPEHYDEIVTDAGAPRGTPSPSFCLPLDPVTDDELYQQLRSGLPDAESGIAGGLNVDQGE